MRLRGRRHWTETITVQSVTHVTSGPNTGEATLTAQHVNVRASVQPASNAEIIRHGLDTDRPVYWVRYEESPPKMGDLVEWREQHYKVVMISEGHDIDTQLLVQLDSAAPPVAP